MTVPPPVIAANRALLAALVATNFFGQNTPAIMMTEALYAEMWAQDAAAMYGYAGASVAAAQVTPFAGDVFLASADTMALPTVLKNEYYYFAHGLSLRARAIGTLGRWETGVDLAQDDFRPINALDRNDAQNALGTADRRARQRLWLGVRPWATLPFKATIAGDHVARDGRMGSVEVTGSELRASTSLGLLF